MKTAAEWEHLFRKSAARMRGFIATKAPDVILASGARQMLTCYYHGRGRAIRRWVAEIIFDKLSGLCFKIEVDIRRLLFGQSRDETELIVLARKERKEIRSKR